LVQDAATLIIYAAVVKLVALGDFFFHRRGGKVSLLSVRAVGQARAGPLRCMRNKIYFPIMKTIMRLAGWLARRSEERVTVWWSLLTAAFGVLTMWGFWSRGPSALGFNLAVFLGSALALMVWRLARAGRPWQAQAAWLVPAAMIVTSFALYDNLFMKLFALLVGVPAIGAFYAAAWDERPVGERQWNRGFMERLAWRWLSPVIYGGEALRRHFAFARGTAGRSGLTKRIAVGVLVLALIAFTVVLPLLASADPAFAALVDGALGWFRGWLTTAGMGKAVCIGLASTAIAAAAIAWGRPLASGGGAARKLDDVVAGIVLGGMLAMYLAFIGVQFRHLWVSELPGQFSQAEAFIKSGFWQLLGLTAINLLGFFGAYGQTGKTVQRILAAFAAASLLLLASAAQRVGLYVIDYGFSHEKFYAAYTVVFCIAVFGWLLRQMLRGRAVDTFRFTAFLALWMLAVAAVLPVEALIVKANVALVERPQTRIRLVELSALSGDAIGEIRRAARAGRLAERVDYMERERREGRGDARPVYDWQDWLIRKETQVLEKRGLELNVSNLLLLLRP
jgi:hypothetical protein